MAAGIELIVSSICNATVCEVNYDNPITDPTQLTTAKTDLYTEILGLSNEINGKHLKIGTYNNYPLSWVETGENGTLIGCGVAFIILSILQKKFNFTYEVITPEKNFEIGGGQAAESLIGLANSSAVDMVAAFVPKILRYTKMVSYSTELDEGVWMMMLKRPKESAAGSGLLAPFDNHVWYLILAAVLLYGPCITLLTRLRAKFVRNDEKHIALSPGFWFVYGALIKQGTTLAPEANTTRVMFATWWLFIILLSAFYTANLTAFLTLSKFTLDIENPEDLYKKNYRWVAAEGSIVQYTVRSPTEDLFYLNKMIANGRAEFRTFDNDQDYLPLVKGGAVLVKEQTAIDHIMYNDYIQKAREGIAESDRCTYVVAPNAFMKKPRAFIYPKNSILKKSFDHLLRYILQSGIIDFLEHRDLPSTKICPLNLQSKDRQLRNSDLMMTYMIMVVGLAAAFAVFIGETLIKRYVHIKINKSKGKSKKGMKYNKRLNIHMYDDGRPPPYDSLFGRNPKYKVTENSKRKIINGREYWVVEAWNGDTRLIPVRTPSAFLYQ